MRQGNQRQCDQRQDNQHAYQLFTDADLTARNTLHLHARARRLAALQRIEALPALLADPALRGHPLLVLGSGSNVLFVTG